MSDTTSVIGGVPTEVGDVPALAVLAVNGSVLCTGALVAPTWVLTAAHCVKAPALGISPTDEVARATTIAFDRLAATATDGVEARGRRIVIDPAFDGDILGGHDVALIELDREITDRAPLPYNVDAARPGDGETMTFVGFGRTDPDDALSAGVAHTLAGRTPVPCATLGDRMPLGDDQMLCFDQRDGRGVCNGDSGGPVLAMIDGAPTIVAINSFVFDPAGVSCNAFAATTRTEAYAGLIAAALEDTREESGGCATATAPSPWLPVAAVALLVVRRRRRPRRRELR